MNFYSKLHSKKDDGFHEVIPLGHIQVQGKPKQVGGYQKIENGIKVKEWNTDGSESVNIGKVAQDDANFLNYQYGHKDSKKTPKPIQSEQKPSPKKLQDAISKRSDSPAVRYINLVNKK